MTGKEVVNLIRKLREKGMSSDEILAIIEYIETHDPKEQEQYYITEQQTYKNQGVKSLLNY